MSAKESPSLFAGRPAVRIGLPPTENQANFPPRVACVKFSNLVSSWGWRTRLAPPARNMAISKSVAAVVVMHMYNSRIWSYVASLSVNMAWRISQLLSVRCLCRSRLQ
jgi:hypothetical protein